MPVFQHKNTRVRWKNDEGNLPQDALEEMYDHLAAQPPKVRLRQKPPLGLIARLKATPQTTTEVPAIGKGKNARPNLF